MNQSEKGNDVAESQEAPNGWDFDDFSLSSDFEPEGVPADGEGAKMEELADIHANCVSKQQYENEKRSWEDKMMGISQRCAQKDVVLDNINSTVREKERTIEKLKQEAAENAEMFNRLQEQIVDLNNILYESNEENASMRRELQSERSLIDELESKLYGPTNYYYQEYLKVAFGWRVYRVVTGDNPADE